MQRDQERPSAFLNPADRQSLPPAPALTLPTGGGAIRGIGEQFAASALSGAAGLTIPLRVTPGRGDLTPDLSLAYDSSAGNGPFGLGWILSVPSIARKTDKGLPQYRDADESDVFMLAGAEDLVPEMALTGSDWQIVHRPLVDDGTSYSVTRYRPRVEQAFARVERFEDAAGVSHWRVTSPTNVVHILGRSPDTRIADPDDPARIFRWLPELSVDDRGNVITYTYVPEDDRGVAPFAQWEAPRSRSANRYLKSVCYGNTTPYFRGDDAQPSSWRFVVVLDYGDHDPARPEMTPDRPWPARADAFSSYRAGFEIRTHRLCRRVLMFHDFPEEPNAGALLVRSTDLTYDENPRATYLAAVRETGYLRNSSTGDYHVVDPDTHEDLSPRSLPPLELTYAPATIDPLVKRADPRGLADLPPGLMSNGWRWSDLDGEGLPGVLAEDSSALFYKRNVSNVPRDSAGDVVALDAATAGTVQPAFDVTATVSTRPSSMALSGRTQRLSHVTGAATVSLVDMSAELAG